MALGNDLVFKFLARLAGHDTAATSGPQGGLPSGYDALFREPAALPGPTVFDPLGPSAVQEQEPIDVPVQVQVDAMERLRQISSGDHAEGVVSLCTHERYLRARGLLDADGRPTLRKQDRLVGLYTLRGQPQWLTPPSQPLYVQEVRPRGHGLSLRNPRRNLWFIEVGHRPKGR